MACFQFAVMNRVSIQPLRKTQANRFTLNSDSSIKPIRDFILVSLDIL